MPHQIVIDLGQEDAVGEVRYLTRQDMPHGRIGEYRSYAGSRLAGCDGGWLGNDNYSCRVELPRQSPPNAAKTPLVVKGEVDWRAVERERHS